MKYVYFQFFFDGWSDKMNYKCINKMKIMDRNYSIFFSKQKSNTDFKTNFVVKNLNIVFCVCVLTFNPLIRGII